VLTILCLASYKKGDEFLRECKRQGCRVILVTLETLANRDWPREAVDEFFYMPSLTQRDDLIHGISYLAREKKLDRIVPLDDYDVETAALLREHLRIPGMGETTARYFRDKLAMRVKARSDGIRVPDFVPVLHYDTIRQFLAGTPGPWLLKPRSEAAAIGIKRVRRAADLWPLLDQLGDRQSYFVLEQFVEGDIFHVDCVVAEKAVVFAQPHRYGHPPMQVAHEGGVFTTRSLPPDAPETRGLLHINSRIIAALGLVRGVSHTEFIRGHADGEFYFLETAARVGGAHIAELVEAATGINLWAEWARVEIAGEGGGYRLPPRRQDSAGIIISLARQEKPDTSAYGDPEIVWRLEKNNHAGLLVVSKDAARLDRLMADYARRFQQDFYATAPLPDKPLA